MSSRGARTARGLTAAAVATLIAALSHTLGGGVVPLGVGTVLAFAFAALACVALAGRALSLWRLGASVVLSQLAFHGLFAVTGSTPLPNVPTHHVSAAALVRELGPIEPVAHAQHAADWMTLAHLAAAVVTIAALYRGERAVRFLLGAVGQAIRVLVQAAPRLSPVVIVRMRASVTPLLLPRELGVVLSSMRHRGPPSAAALA